MQHFEKYKFYPKTHDEQNIQLLNAGLNIPSNVNLTTFLAASCNTMESDLANTDALPNKAKPVSAVISIFFIIIAHNYNRVLYLSKLFENSREAFVNLSMFL